MKHILILSLLLSFSFSSNCKITADRDYYVGDYINKNLYSHCKKYSHLFFTSKYFISKNTIFSLDYIKKQDENNLIELKNNIKIKFKGKVVENIDGKIKVKDSNGRLQVYNLKELL